MERETRNRKEIGLIGMQGPWSRAGGPVSRPLSAATICEADSKRKPVPA